MILDILIFITMIGLLLTVQSLVKQNRSNKRKLN